MKKTRKPFKIDTRSPRIGVFICPKCKRQFLPSIPHNCKKRV